ncbi:MULTISPECIES: diaminopimelate decarboxylase [unclassified Methanoregula]|uniref:diaminopimelate decarboxylase n=1 Tax=unclassified Methanoregula TaxID=2649730 RepID=UPI0009D2F950|nr:MULTISPECIES: diaminopimelate decarboxylase [unclassified Methanoregula]OPX63154.1 MAG: Diaminopimelate decarboxylase [Methanoregula sp. PtaB.Bin085]OPY33453.1 MAG: Diaminopimelate decarboxylase [Methanoregula sp. PtaU1.Bin006]
MQGAKPITKTVPFTKARIEELEKRYPTPFHIYDEEAIRAGARRLYKAFSWVTDTEGKKGGFTNFFAVKALPNPSILRILHEEGMGADCSSLPELLLADAAGIKGEEIMFTSNDTPADEFALARKMGAVINLDDITHIGFLEKAAGIPRLICFRYNPGEEYSHGNAIIGNPAEAKYGLTHDQILKAYTIARKKGAQRFGLHAMIVSNQRDEDILVEAARLLFNLAVEIKEKTGIRVEFINLGGGIGIPYSPVDHQVDLERYARGVHKAYKEIIAKNGLAPMRIVMESGRAVTGPYGYLVSRVRHVARKHRDYVGLDACMANLMRPALYGAYHHITVLGKEKKPLDHVYDVTGSLCENNDKFAVQRFLPAMSPGDLVVIHDTGAHGHAMGFNYNGKLRSAEFLMQKGGTFRLIRRAETANDYFATLDFEGSDFSGLARK